MTLTIYKKEKIKELRKQGDSIRAIAAKLHISQTTVNKYKHLWESAIVSPPFVTKKHNQKYLNGLKNYNPPFQPMIRSRPINYILSNNIGKKSENHNIIIKNNREINEDEFFRRQSEEKQYINHLETCKKEINEIIEIQKDQKKQQKIRKFEDDIEHYKEINKVQSQTRESNNLLKDVESEPIIKKMDDEQNNIKTNTEVNSTHQRLDFRKYETSSLEGQTITPPPKCEATQDLTVNAEDTTDESSGGSLFSLILLALLKSAPELAEMYINYKSITQTKKSTKPKPMKAIVLKRKLQLYNPYCNGSPDKDTKLKYSNK